MAGSLHEHRAMRAAWLLVCVIAPIFAGNLIWWCDAWPGWEPFTTWTSYLTGWAYGAAVFTCIFAVPVGIACAVIAHRKHTVLCAALGSLVWYWAAVPLIAGWCVARLLLASYDPGFDGTLYDGKLPPSWKGTLSLLALDVNCVLIVLATLVVVVVNGHRRRQRAAEAIRFMCLRCGYSLQGLTANICPECGTVRRAETTITDPRTTQP